MSLKSEFTRGAAIIAVALALSALAVSVSDRLRAGGHWPSAAPEESIAVELPSTPAAPEAASPGIISPEPDSPEPANPAAASPEIDAALPEQPEPATSFETVLEAQLSWGTPILDVFALCHGRTQLETGDSEFRHSRVEGVDWLEYYESAALPGGEIAIRGFRAPMAAVSASSADGILVVTADDAEFIGGAWHITSMGEIGDAIQLEAAPGLAIPACLDADAAAAQLNAVFDGDRGEVRARRRD
tara:strand:+ start:2132 stop:2863 length:732 start_codon:yes stop_codon:yes gene_type:complete